LNGYIQQFAEGLLLTLQVSAGSFCMGLAFAVPGAVAKLSRHRGWRWLGGKRFTRMRLR
jgi:ABC-type arginine transport system permease subunit